MEDTRKGSQTTRFLAESNRIGRTVEEVLHRTPEVVSMTRRTGRAELDEHAAGVNQSEIEVVTNPMDRPHTAVMDEVRKNLKQKTKYASWIALKLACDRQGIVVPSYKTFTWNPLSQAKLDAIFSYP